MKPANLTIRSQNLTSSPSSSPFVKNFLLRRYEKSNFRSEQKSLSLSYDKIKSPRKSEKSFKIVLEISGMFPFGDSKNVLLKIKFFQLTSFQKLQKLSIYLNISKIPISFRQIFSIFVDYLKNFNGENKQS